jgi:subtilisin family serine protease
MPRTTRPLALLVALVLIGLAGAAAPEALLARLGADRWHEAGRRGGGVKVAVLDTGFRGWRDHLGRALPTRVAARSFRTDGGLEARDSQHGIRCGEVVHAIAPDAELLFATWEPDRPDRFLEAVAWARQQGAKVVTCSVIMPAWSDGEGGGAVHAELARRLDGALMFASAGNTARRHWSGPFQGGAGGWHEWRAGQTENLLLPWDESRVSVELCGPPGARYEVRVTDEAGGEVGTSSGFVGPDRSCVAVRFQPLSGATYRVRVRLLEGKPGPFHLVALGAHLEASTTAGSIPFPGDGPEVIAVGAVTAGGERLDYSSCGPNRSAPKPDCVACVPFPTAGRERPFSGTSAAAPQAAALAALVWSRHPDWTAGRVRRELMRGCRDLGPPGHDAETGFGLVRLPTD